MTDKQKRFVDEYLIDLNATQACIRAGYKANSQNAYEVIGHQLLQKTSVKKAVSIALAERSRRTGINADLVVQELARIAFLNPKNVIDAEDGSILPNASEDDLRCIQSVKVKTMDTDKGVSQEREVRFSDKLKALELLGKHLGMWSDKFQVDIAIPVFGGEAELED